MDNQYQIGQILRFKKPKFKLWEDDYYFVVIGYKNGELWMQVLNTNDDFETGYTIVPESESSFEPVEVFSFQILKTEARIKEVYSQEIVYGEIIYAENIDCPIVFTPAAEGLESNIYFGMGEENFPDFKGKLFIKYPDIFYS